MGRDPPPATQPPPRASAPPKANRPEGDRPHIPGGAQKLVQILANEMQRVKDQAPSNFQPQANRIQERLNLLSYNLNNGKLQPDIVNQLSRLGEALEEKAYDVAHELHADLVRDKPKEFETMMVSCSRLCYETDVC